MQIMADLRERGFQAQIEAKDTPEFWKGIRHLGLDMDDTTVEHDPDDLVGKFGEAVIHARAPHLITPGSYIAAIRTPQGTEAYFAELDTHGQTVFGLEQGAFLDHAWVWAKGTATRDERKKVVEEVLGFETEEDFWISYRAFDVLVPRERIEFLRFTEGSEEFLRFVFSLREQGILQGVHIVSNNKTERLLQNIAFIKSKGLPDFDHVISARDDIGKKKPEPDALIELSRRVGLQIGQNGEVPALYVGNGDEDAIAGDGAHWPVAIINPHGKDFSSVSIPHFQFKDPAHLHRHWAQKIASK